MAKVTRNILLQGLSGSIGDMVFRQMPDGSTQVSAKPVPRRRKWSRKQKEQQSRFRQGVAYARQAAKDEPIYTRLTRGKSMNAYNLALADWFSPPVIQTIEREEGVIRVTAHDNVKVVKVEIRIMDGDGRTLEYGQAEQVNLARDPGQWEYAANAEGTVEATAWDLAGNQTQAVL